MHPLLSVRQQFTYITTQLWRLRSVLEAGPFLNPQKALVVNRKRVALSSVPQFEVVQGEGGEVLSQVPRAADVEGSQRARSQRGGRSTVCSGECFMMLPTCWPTAGEQLAMERGLFCAIQGLLCALTKHGTPHLLWPNRWRRNLRNRWRRQREQRI